ncbi:MAG: hypothetical protein RL068_526 [Actinomycetota bacterium]|jgi:hypothetical protein
MRYLEFWEKFQTAEKKADVYNIKTIGFQLYPMLRTRLYYQLAQELGLFDNPHPNPEPKEVIDLEVEPASLVGKHEIVVVPFVRKIAGIDVYSQPLIDAFGENALVLEVSDPHAALDLERIKSFGKGKFDRVVYELMLKEKVRDVRDRWDLMAKVFEAELGVGLGKFAEFPNWLVRRYIGECLAFKEFFLAMQTKRLYVVNAYSHPALVVGAKQAGVRVIEIQHGFISKYHPAYSYPKQRVQCAPNRIMVWGEYWAKSTPFAKGLKALVTGPSKQFLQQRQNVNSGSRVEGSILFTSQGALGADLMQQALHWASQLPDHKVIYRLHPNEDLADYAKFSLPKNLELSHKNPGFLELLSEAEYLVGGFSTTLYEGLSFGLKVIVLPLPGYENVQAAIDRGDMFLADLDASALELQDLLHRAKPCANPYSYYAKDFNLKRALSA